MYCTTSQKTGLYSGANDIAQVFLEMIILTTVVHSKSSLKYL